MHHDQRRGGGKLDGKVAVRHGVERVGTQAVEAKLLSDALAVDGEARARKRRAAQRQEIDPLAAFGETLSVSGEHRVIGEEVMAEGYRLRHLQVRESRHDGFCMLFGQIEQRVAQALDRRCDRIDSRAQVEPQIGRHLIVARASGMKSLPGVSDERHQPLFDVEVDVLEIARPGELAALDFTEDRRKSSLDRGDVFRAQNLRRAEHSGMGAGRFDVSLSQPAIEVHRCGVQLDELIDRLTESSGPAAASPVVGMLFV